MNDPRQIKQWEQEMMKTHGWYVHYISGKNGYANIHTHGLRETFNHPDLQIVMLLKPNIAQGIFTAMIDEIQMGQQFQEGKLYDQVLVGYPVMVKAYEEMGRMVLRVLLPDGNGYLPGHPKCDPIFQGQLRRFPYESGSN